MFDFVSNLIKYFPLIILLIIVFIPLLYLFWLILIEITSRFLLNVKNRIKELESKK